MKKILALVALISLIFSGSAIAMQDMKQGEMKKDDSSMEGMEHGSQNQDGKFVHMDMAGDVHTEFQVMDLAGMNTKDMDGKTHHVMATFKRDDKNITKAIGKVKLVSPSGKEQLADLKDYGSGIFAANFTIDEPGKWGIVCLFKDDMGEQHTVKFWYPHMSM